MIDAHTHRYPAEIYLRPKDFAQKQGELHWLELVSPTCGPKLQGWASREQMIADMDNAKVDQTVLLGWYWENPDTCILHNDWHAQWIKEDADRFYAFASINPKIGDAVGELQKRQEQGFVGIGEIHLGVQGFTMQVGLSIFMLLNRLVTTIRGVFLLHSKISSGLLANFHSSKLFLLMPGDFFLFMNSIQKFETN
jgi:predicted TIM-barrel fold metal-dependent hydrolase